MGMSISTIASSGLRAAARALEVSSSNVANMATPGFSPSRTELSATRDGGVQADVRRDVQQSSDDIVSHVSGTDVTSELISMMSAQRAFTASMTVLKAEQEMTSAILDLRR